VNEHETSTAERWARLRFAIIGPLLAAPPAPGELHAALEQLAAKSYRHPLTGEPVQFAFSTLERWLYTAQSADRDPVAALRARRRTDAGRSRRLSQALRQTVHEQYRLHPSWSVQLHYDNLTVLVAEDPALSPLPSYATVRRYLRANGLNRRPRRRRPHTPGAQAAERHLATCEVRSYELEYVNALWHADYHVGSRRVLTPEGRWDDAHLLGTLDDCSRLASHVQWYPAEQAQTFVHGLTQGFQKYGLPRALLTDNGGAETAAELTEGLARLGIVHETTLPYSPYQNAKQEVFWAQVEGRLLPMLEHLEPLTLDILNDATLPWVEMEYNRSKHRELGCTPLERFLQGPDVARESPNAETLRRTFRATLTRTQRRSDGTATALGTRFEVPSRYRHLPKLRLRYARWDLSTVDLIDPHTEQPVATLYPLDKHRNAEQQRRALEPLAVTAPTEASVAQHPSNNAGAIAPLLRHLIAEYAATGLPPAYLPFNPEESKP